MGLGSRKCAYVRWRGTERELISSSMEGSQKIRLKLKNEKKQWGTWEAPSAKRRTLDFDSGQDRRVKRLSPIWGSILGMEPTQNSLFRPLSPPKKLRNSNTSTLKVTRKSNNRKSNYLCENNAPWGGRNRRRVAWDGSSSQQASQNCLILKQSICTSDKN